MLLYNILLIIKGCPDRQIPKSRSNHTSYGKVYFTDFSPKFIKVQHGLKKNSASNLKKKPGRFFKKNNFKLGFRPRNFSFEKKSFHANLKNVN